HRFESLAQVPVNELDEENYILRTHCEFMDYYEDLGLEKEFQVKIRYSSEREDWVQAMILAGMGCSVMPEFLPNLSGIATRVLAEPAVARTISLVTVSGRRFSPAVESLIRLVRQYDWEAATGAQKAAPLGDDPAERAAP
ncbi:MAG: LysR family transcriptional regulator substrate-binding protein, partial [Kiloniellales bacterium]|nr:LysR family transcriptional regulator substrate-binding protein [Kiloniellales bacterium]